MRSVLSAVVVLIASATVFSADITLDDLLNEMVDLKRLTYLPDPAYVTKQASSYDRASVKPGNDDWFANGDAGHFIRVEKRNGRDEFVLLDAEGPGAVVRMWSAKPSGVMRIYIDGNDAPALQVSMEDLLSGKVEHIGEPFAGIRSRGYNLYFPIPYSKHCKITTDVGGYHYHVNYRTYERGADVESFNRELLKRSSATIKRIAEQLDLSTILKTTQHQLKFGYIRSVMIFGGDSTLPKCTLNRDVPDGADAGVVSLVMFDIKSENVPEALRALLLHVTCDGEKTVVCPLGDFFGIAGDVESYVSVAMGVKVVGPDHVQMWSLWPMPYRKSVSVEVEPVGGSVETQIVVRHDVQTEPYEWNDRSLYFNAGWRQTKDIPTRPFSDWTHLDCKGNGRYVGGMLHVINNHRAWWGEGDEKIYVDGEQFPSHFGTGSEDYFGYAWCDPTPFTHAYHSQVLCDGPGVYGNTVLNRLHIIDDIPFKKSFKFDMENWHWREDTTTTRAATSYWYARPGGTDTFEPLTDKNCEYVNVPEYVPNRVKDALEGESLRVVKMTAGETRLMDRGEAYSGETELWWLGGRVGDKLTLGFDVPEAGRYHVIARISKGHDFGIIDAYINDQQVIEKRDMYVPYWFALMPEENLGEFELVEGENRLTIEVVGKNDKAQDHYAFGVDYLLLKKTSTH